MTQEYKNCIADLIKQKSVPQHGKDYFTVATRHNLFMKYFNNAASINTDIIPELCNDKRVAVKCTIYIGSNKYTGMALEEFGSSFINKTSALENAETSALGRALAAFGLHGSEFASADELINAKINQIPKTNGKKNIKLDMQFDIDRIRLAIKDINGLKALRDFKKQNPELFDSNNMSVREYKQITDLYETRQIQLNTQGVTQ
jgi:hypothetical protein